MSTHSDSPSALSRRSVLRRAAAVGLMATPAAGFLSACATGGGDNNDDKGKDATKENPFGVEASKPLDVVIFDGGFGQDYAKNFKSIYESKYSGAQVGLLFSKKIRTEMQPRFNGGNPPDVLNNSSPEPIPPDTLTNSNQLEDLTRLLDADGIDGGKVRDALLPGVVESGVLAGKPYVLNYAYTIYGVWYNAKLFKDNNWQPPKTWDEFATLAEAAKAKGIAAWTHQGKFPWYMHNVIMDWIYIVGGLDAAKKIDNLEPDAWKQDAVKVTLEKVHEMVTKKWIQPGAEALDHTTTQQAWLDGKALFIPCGTWLENEMKKTIPPGFEMTVAPQWNLTSSDKSPYGTVRAAAGEGFVVPSAAKNKPGALEFLRIMLSKDAARKFAELTSSLPVVKGAADGLTTSTALASASKVAGDAGTNIIEWKFNTWYGDLYTAMEGAITSLMSGKSDPAKFMDTMQKAADKVKADPKIKKQTRS
ncbi:MAG TPA: N-acetylglucosamine/diacetylchitobiose ABC transporter substrate-binding protein [Pilimelia sp.]|nr:N-acetylglucosamine/diacetylchitobiose ABC transporter substrate-binding protein [Pilimelia sp.]